MEGLYINKLNITKREVTHNEKTLYKSLSWSGIFIFLFLFFLIVGGWINNINYILDSDFDSISGREIVSVIGVPIGPVGVINGVVYFFEEEKNETVINE